MISCIEVDIEKYTYMTRVGEGFEYCHNSLNHIVSSFNNNIERYAIFDDYVNIGFYTMIETNTKELWLCYLEIKECYRGYGYGKKVLDILKDKHDEIWLKAREDSLIEYYKKNGWDVVDGNVMKYTKAL